MSGNAERVDVAVIGGGVMGVSIAHHLSAAGAGRVLLLEKRFIGAGSSGRSGAIIRQHYSTLLLVQMARAGVLAFRDFEQVCGGDSGWIPSGCLVVASERDRAAAEGNVQLMRAAGARAELRTGAGLQEALPQGAFAHDEIGAWEPEAGCVDAARVLHAFAASAARQGVDVREAVEVTSVESRSGRLGLIRTTGGDVAAGAAVLCAGPWARKLAARAGLDLPLTVIRPQVAFRRRPGDFGSEHHPVIADLANGLYSRPELGGRTLIGALDVSGDEVVSDPDNYREAPDDAFLSWCHARVSRRLPIMKRSFGRGGYGALYTLTPDSHPIIGRAPGVGGLYLAVGFSGHGFKLSPAVGRGLAELITTGAYQSLDLSPLRPTRFADGQPIRGAYDYGLLS